MSVEQVALFALLLCFACTLANVMCVAVCVKLYSEIVKTGHLKRIATND